MGSPVWLSVRTQCSGMGEGSEAQDGGNICIMMADLCCAADTNITFQSNYPPVKKEQNVKITT